MWSRVVMLEDGTLPICQTRTFLLNSGLQFFQLIAVNIRVNRCIGRKEFKVEDTLPIPSNWKQNLLWMKTCFRDCFWRFRKVSSRSFPFNIVVNDPIFTPIGKVFKNKNRFFFAFLATNRMLKSGGSAGLRSIGWNPHIDLANVTNFFKHLEMVDFDAFTMSVIFLVVNWGFCSTICFSWPFSIGWPFGARSIFDWKISRRELGKPFLFARIKTK